MRFLVVGAGPLGCYVGGRLAVDGNEVVFMERDPVRAVLGARGLRIEKKNKALVVETPDIYVDPESAGFFDVVLVCVRTAETESILEEVRPLLSFDCGVISLQSGIDAMYRLREVFGDQHVMPGFVRVALESRSAAVVEELDPEPGFMVGEFDGRGSWRLDCIQIAFESAGFTVATSKDMLAEQWRNFLLEAAMASMATQNNSGIQQLLREPECRARLRELLAEGITISAAEGVALHDTPELLLSLIESGSGETWLHMRRDMAAGRTIENAALAGSLSRRARKLGIAAAAWTRLYEELESRALGLSPGRGTSIPPVRAR